jgi:hypothetical protein
VLPAVVSFLDDIPLNAPETWWTRLRWRRERLGHSRKHVTRVLGIDDSARDNSLLLAVRG